MVAAYLPSYEKERELLQEVLSLFNTSAHRPGLQILVGENIGIFFLMPYPCHEETVLFAA